MSNRPPPADAPLSPSPDDASTLLCLADRLDAAGRAFVALAARDAAAAAQAGRAPHLAALRRKALEVAVALDTRGLPAEARAIFDEVVRRARGTPDALPDRPFQAWLEAVEARFPERSSPVL